MVYAANSDPHELDKFGHLAEEWWNPSGPFQPLHQLNPLRLHYVQERVGTLTGKQVLDVGCGGGIFSESMARQGATVLGIDLAEPVIAVARRHQALSERPLSLDYQLESSTQRALTHPGSFDVVTCMEMLEHVPDPTQTIQECAALVKPGGWVFFSTLNRTLRAYGLAIIGAEYVARLLPRGTHDYSQFIRPSELASWCRAAGLTVHSMRGVSYNVWNQCFRLSSDTSVNYMLACRRDSS
jgi:2-polyprenyl-6-hydroxyphenyl methylase / 3-demethylubiquinone-9 3-methyltransferase